MIVPSLLFALGAHLAAASPAGATAVDLDGAPVDLRAATVLIVDPDDRGAVRQTLEGLKAQGKTAPSGSHTALVIVLDLSDVPSLLEGYAKVKVRERAAEVGKRPIAQKISLSWVVDMDGSLSQRLRGPLEGSALVKLDDEGAYARGVALATATSTAEAPQRGSEP